jgi:hypothetical protein
MIPMSFLLYILKRRGMEFFLASLIFASTTTLILTWFHAFFGYDYSVIVRVNAFNEAVPELLMWVLFIICVVLYTPTLFRIVTRDAKFQRRKYYRITGKKPPVTTMEKWTWK